MNKICPKCAVDPTSHSFKKVSDKGGITIYYSHPSKAKLYDDLEGILSHVDNMLTLQGKKPWMCILDGDGFDVKHAAQVRIGVALMDMMMNKYGATMKEFKVINPTWHIHGQVTVAKMTLSSELFTKIVVLDDRKHSILEFI
jgi:hypothetical protein